MSDIFLNHISAPLRPVEEDLSICNDLIAMMHQSRDRLDALILGVTPEYFHLNWPENTSLSAIDKTPEMVENVWPGERAQVTLGSWEELPFSSASKNLVLCDGGLHLLSHPHKMQQLVRKINDIIDLDGYLLLRLFLPSASESTPEEVLEDLTSGKIPSLNHLKMKLASSLQKNVTEGVQLADIWDTLHSIENDQEKLALQLGWDLKDLQAINVYQNSPVKYHLLSLEEVTDLFTTENDHVFHVEKVIYPTYYDGEHYPTIIFKKSNDQKKSL
jgi:SAM-dependent methyltransferase